jgi:hypothetical protein
MGTWSTVLSRLLLAGVLILSLAAAACHEESSGQVAACPEIRDPAVVLMLMDETGAAVSGASLRYQWGPLPWQEWPERTAERTVIRGGPGPYRLEVSAPGFEVAEALVSVASDPSDGCRPLAQTVTLQLSLPPCPQAPEPLLLALEPSLPGVALNATLPDSGGQSLTCLAGEGETCRQYELPTEQRGQYRLNLSGLPGLGAMDVVDGVVVYRPAPATLLLDHRGRQERVELTGADSAEVTFQVRGDEANCSLADFRELELSLRPDPRSTEPRPSLSVSYLGSLTMTDLGAEACRAAPVMTSLPFGLVLPDGTNLAEARVQVHYGEDWQGATCEFTEGAIVCRALVPNPLLGRPFALRALLGEQEATGMQLPFTSMCLIFR